MRAILLVPLVAAAMLGCFTKEADFFPTANPIVDEDGPIFLDYLPAASLPGPFNINTFRFKAVDLTGLNGAPPSGVDVNSIEVLRGPTPMTVTRSGDNYTVDLTGITDGPVVLSLGGKDLYGNSRSAGVNFILKRTPPSIAFTNAPQLNWQSNRPMETLRYSGTIMDPFLRFASGRLYRAGMDGQCRADNALLWPVGNATPNSVSQNTFDYGLSGQFQVNFDFWNAVLPGGSPTIAELCFGITGADGATDANGGDNRNTITVWRRSNLEWRSAPQVSSVVVTPNNVSLTHPATQQMTATVNADPGVSTGVTWSATPGTVGTINQNGLVTTVGAGQLDIQACSTIAPTVCGTARLSVLPTTFNFNINLALSYVNVAPALRYSCANITVSPASGAPPITGGTISTTWTGPGVVGTTTRTATLPASNQAFDWQQLSLSGIYNANVSVTANGVTTQATGSVTVGETQGSCNPGTQSKTAVVSPPTSDTHGHEPFIAQAGTRTAGVTFTTGTTASISGLLVNSSIVLSGTVSGNSLTLSGSGIINLAGGQTRNATVSFTGTISATGITGVMNVTIQGFPNPTAYPVNITF